MLRNHGEACKLGRFNTPLCCVKQANGGGRIIDGEIMRYCGQNGINRRGKIPPARITVNDVVIGTQPLAIECKVAAVALGRTAREERVTRK